MSYNFRTTTGFPASASDAMSTAMSLKTLSREHGEERLVASIEPMPATPFGQDRDTVVNRLLDQVEQARLQGHTERADELMIAAWEAYERPD